MVAALEGAYDRSAALRDRLQAGDDSAAAEAHEMAVELLAELFGALGTQRARALRERLVAGEHVDEDEAREMVLDAFAGTDT